MNRLKPRIRYEPENWDGWVCRTNGRFGWGKTPWVAYESWMIAPYSIASYYREEALKKKLEAKSKWFWRR